MRIILFSLIGGTALAAAGVAGLRLNSSASAATDTQGNPSVERFLLQASGDEHTCPIEKAKGNGRLTYVKISPQCDELLPGLSKARYWIENPDGTVTLSADGRSPAVIFAQSDGVAYESIEPRMPLMQLIGND
jgi:hypothetical protein